MLLVEYRCRRCAGRSEHWVSRPVPPVLACPACEGTAARRFGGALGGRAHAVPSTADRTDPSPCLQDSRAPGICHMHPSAARRWSAMGRGDTRAVEREIAHQESAIAAGTLSPGDAFGHSHSAPPT